MKITELQAYKRLEAMFEQKGYSRGVKDDMATYVWDDMRNIPANITPGHYVYALSYNKIRFWDIPESYLTREFFLHALSGAFPSIVEYVRIHSEKFDRQFFKDHIETNYYSLEFALNDFEYMPLEYIDEEMVACAMFRSIEMCSIHRRGVCDDWFYSVYRRKPEILTQELYILGARCFAEKIDGKNKFLDITPEEYRTPEYFLALCLNNNTPVMEDIPESVLTPQFLIGLLNDKTENIQCFNESALEKEVKYWQVVIINDGWQIINIPLNDERVEFFLSIYDKDSLEYQYAFKDHYKRYLREKNSVPDLGTGMMNAATDRQSILPIYYDKRVPKEYSKKYDSEEYLLEIYKKLGIQVLQEINEYYYSISLPENFSIVQDNYGYCVKDSNGEILLHYCDSTDAVDKINVILE